MEVFGKVANPYAVVTLFDSDRLLRILMMSPGFSSSRLDYSFTIHTDTNDPSASLDKFSSIFV